MDIHITIMGIISRVVVPTLSLSEHAIQRVFPVIGGIPAFIANHPFVQHRLSHPVAL
jgi:hypothetical protein